MSISQNRFGPHCNSLIFRGKFSSYTIEIKQLCLSKNAKQRKETSITEKKILTTCVTNKDGFPVQAKLSAHTIVLKMPVSKVNGRNNPNI